MIRRIHSSERFQRQIVTAAKSNIFSGTQVEAAHLLNRIADLVGTSIVDDHPSRDLRHRAPDNSAVPGYQHAWGSLPQRSPK